MTFQVPTYTAPGQAWQLVDYKPALTLTATADRTGTATAQAPPVDPGYMWAIQRAVSSTSLATTGAQVRLYDAPASAAALLSGSNSAAYDEADYPAGPGMLIDQSRQLTAVWTRCQAGEVCTLRLQIGVMQQVSVS